MSPPSTPNHPNQDLLASSLLFGAGMLLPLAAVIVARDLVALYLSGPAFSAAAAAGFVPVAWAFVVRVDPDRPNFLTAALVTPLGAVVVALGLVAMGPAAGIIDFLAGGNSGWDEEVGVLLGYLGAMAAAGVVGLWLADAYERQVAAYARLPSSTGVLRGLAAVLLVCAVAVIVANGAAARGATVTDVAPAVDDRPPALNITVAGPPAELRVTVIDPRGNGVTRRVSVADLRDGRATARFPLWFERLLWGRTDAVPGRLAAEPGDFAVRVTTLSGLSVERTTYEVPRDPPGIVAGPFVDADASGRFGPAAAGTACEAYRAGGIEGAIIGVAVENPSELPAAAELFLHPDPPPNAEGRAVLESSLAGDSGVLPPGTTGCLSIELTPSDVESLRQAGGVGYLDLRVRGESVARPRVEVPTDGNETAAAAK